ncbi:penicillin-binding protein activator [Phaeobacter italicus]|uniref:penicillin-binding protein activator n=1 Tax=Phaeobacter italicus TaxID=481446 RepID=UPI00248D47B5|nr:penicillin-binding protein activator [Phaeobacter italicus]
MSAPPKEQDPRHREGALSRRRVLKALSALPLLTVSSACGQLPLPALSRRSDATGRAALLLPLSGTSDSLGQSLQNAATLGGGPGIGIDIIDSGSTPETAVMAAQQAVNAGAKIIVGPVFAAQAKAVAQAVRVPVVTLSNDETLAQPKTFVFGVTAAQSARAVLSIAAQRNIKTIVTVAPPGPFGQASADAATSIGTLLGLTMRPAIIQSNSDNLIKALSQNGTLPDAVYLPVADATLVPFANTLRGKNIQLLGSTQWAALDLTRQRAFQNAWFAAPDPVRFAAFDDAFTTATGQPGGIITGLAFDGVDLLRRLNQTRTLSLAGLTRPQGFTGVLGPYRFRKSGICDRALGVLSVTNQEFNLIGSTAL